MDVFFIQSARDDFLAAFELLTIAVMGRSRSAKGRFSKWDSVHYAARAQAEKRKITRFQDAEDDRRSMSTSRVSVTHRRDRATAAQVAQ